MKKLLTIAALAILVVPTAHAVPPDGKGKPESPGKSANAPGQSLEQNAAKACKAERGTTADSRAAFKAKYGTNANKANAFGKCVSKQAAKLEQVEEAKENAAKACKTERGTTADSMAAFKAKYGTNANKANAFGKCVSQKVKQAQS